MKTLEQSKDKIKKICDILREETLEPAKKEAENILAEAHKKASQIVSKAEKEAEQILNETRKTIKQERNVFHSSLLQASKQSLEALRQSIEDKIFNKQLQDILEKESSDPATIAKIINAIVKGIEKDGLATDLMALISKTVSPQAVIELLLKEVREKLQNKTVTIGNFTGGAQVKITHKNMIIDVTDESLKELLASYIRKDFRKLIFGS